MDLLPLSPVSHRLNASNGNVVRHRFMPERGAPQVLSDQLEWTKSAEKKHSSKSSNAILIDNNLSEICPLGLNGSFFESVSRQERGLFQLRSEGGGAHHFTFPPSCLVGNISGGHVRNQSLPKALATSRDC